MEVFLKLELLCNYLNVNQCLFKATWTQHQDEDDNDDDAVE